MLATSTGAAWPKALPNPCGVRDRSQWTVLQMISRSEWGQKPHADRWLQWSWDCLSGQVMVRQDLGHVQPASQPSLPCGEGGAGRGQSCCLGPTWQMSSSVFSERRGLCSERTECRDKLEA